MFKNILNANTTHLI